MKTREKLVLIDAHAVIHRAYHALPAFTSPSGAPTGALYGLSAFLIKIMRDLKPDYMAACYDLPGPTFRSEMSRQYKAQRVKPDDDLITQLISSRAVFRAFGIPIYDAPGFEADDIIGTIAENVKCKAKNAKESLQIVIASGDMDTLQLVSDDDVVVYTLKKGINDTVIYDEKGVKERFGFGPELLPDYKGLRGDPSDNIPGVKGVGEKTAAELIKEYGSIENIFDSLEKMKPKTQRLLAGKEEEATFSKILGTIRKDAPIHFELPQAPWQKTFDKRKAQDFLTEVGFRSLVGRLNEDKEVEENIAEKKTKESGAIDEETEKILIALWLLDSSKTNPSEEEALSYTGAKTLEEAGRIIFKKIKEDKLEKVLEEIELPLIPILKKAKERGILVDRHYLKKLSTDYHIELTKLEKKIWKALGEELNLNSPKQLSEVLLRRLKIGLKSTQASELEKYKDKWPVLADILAYREYQKLLSTYIDNLPAMLDKENRLHTTLVQTGASTGRMSSEQPNLQNIPIKTDLGRNIRRAFLASPGHKLVSFDYSQIELRVAALLSRDPKLTKAFEDGEDIHEAVAMELFGVGKGEVTKDMRRQAKVLNFGILYGMGVNALRQNLGTTKEEAQQYYINYFRKFSGLANYLDKVKSEAARRGYTETYFGRRRYFPELRSPLPYLVSAAERMAMNAPLQGTAADIIKIAMGKCDTVKDAHLLLQIHDELVYEVPDGKVEEVTPIIKKTMESVLKTNIPFIVNATVADHL